LIVSPRQNKEVRKKMSDNNQVVGNQGGSAKRGFIIIAAFLIIIILLVAVIAFLLGRNGSGSNNNVNQTSSSTENSRNVLDATRMVLDEESAANVMDEMRQEVEEGMFECNMSMTWTFADGSSKSKDAYVANSTNNKYPIYFDVELKDTGEVIYSSPVLPVGSQLTNFALDKDIDPGEYKARVVYYLIRDEQSQEVVSSAAFIIKLNVNN
jgi:hypothetical protein